jgi:putative transposase
LFGITRQAYYQHYWNDLDVSVEEEIILQLVNALRIKHRCMGTRKLYELLQQDLLDHQIKMGRDALFDLLSANNLLVKKRRRRVATTNSLHRFRKYTNLIKGKVPTAANQIWVSDITYLKASERFVYISLVTDAYSKKIVGYQVAERLDTIHSVQALQMALDSLQGDKQTLIHHSDRGIQYCSAQYVNLLQDNQIQISMTESGDPLDNALAERVNGIIKQEYLTDRVIEDIEQARELLSIAVNLYNSERPHLSNNMLTPDQTHKQTGELTRLWKNYYKKRALPDSTLMTLDNM